MRLRDYINHILNEIEREEGVTIKFHDIIRTELPNFLKRYTNSRDTVDLSSVIRNDAKDLIKGFIELEVPVKINKTKFLDLIQDLDSRDRGYKTLVHNSTINSLKGILTIEFNRLNIRTELRIEPNKDSEYVYDIANDYIVTMDKKVTLLDYIVKNMRNHIDGKRFQEIVDYFELDEYDNEKLYDELVEKLNDVEAVHWMLMNLYVTGYTVYGTDCGIRIENKINNKFLNE